MSHAEQSKSQLGGDVARLQMMDHIASLLLEAVAQKENARKEEEADL